MRDSGHSTCPCQPNMLENCMIISCLFFVIYFLLSFFFVPSTIDLHLSAPVQSLSSSSSLQNIVFGISSSEKTWSRRKEYVRLWWRPEKMKGCVFLEKKPPNTSLSKNDLVSLPPICVSEDTSRFPYTHYSNQSSAIRVARVVSETVALNHGNVNWFVFGDDDTIFFPDNLVRTLSKYDHDLWYYIGSSSESFTANKLFSFDMAFGGGGFAISYPLAKVLAKVLDSCLERYPHLYGSDARIHACLTEVGITLTHEPGFHQMDVKGNIFGLLTAHPVRPLVTLHHLETAEPIFPNMTVLKALEHFIKATEVDSVRALQQTVCFDQRLSLTISVSWGYAVQLIGTNVLLPDVIRSRETYRPWSRSHHHGNYNLDTQRDNPDPPSSPIVYFLDSVSSTLDGSTSIYKIHGNVNFTYGNKIDEIRVFSRKLQVVVKQLQSPRRQCCDVLRSSADNVIEIGIRECGPEELIHMHP